MYVRGNLWGPVGPGHHAKQTSTQQVTAASKHAHSLLSLNINNIDFPIVNYISIAINIYKDIGLNMYLFIY